jgi:pyruvate dehydrogenase E2 component (dihydrolipoamide acetyltransferase)
MAEQVLMPKAGITVEECIITEWVKKKGDTVKVGDILFQYETDKASFECEATADGEILEIYYEDGAEVPVLTPVCAIGNPGEHIESNTFVAEAPKEKEESEKIAASEVVVKDVIKAEPAFDITDSNEKISPRARMTAKTLEIDPTLATPTGPYGRIIEKDIRIYAVNRAGSGFGGKEAEEALPELVATTEKSEMMDRMEADYIDNDLSNVRKAIAKTMMKSLSSSAQLTLQNSFDATVISQYRNDLKINAESFRLPNITLNDIILFTVSRVLVHYPSLNAHLLNDITLRSFKNVHLGMAVDTPRGLMVPTIFNANRKSLAEISVEAKELAMQCQQGTISPDQLTGASFTVTNLGSLGIESFTPVINPPQTGILGVTGIHTRVKEVNDEIKAYKAMNLCLTIDHRAMDGALGGKFLKELANTLESFHLILAK